MVCFFAAATAAALSRGRPLRPRDSAAVVIPVVAAKKQTIKADNHECSHCSSSKDKQSPLTAWWLLIGIKSWQYAKIWRKRIQIIVYPIDNLFCLTTGQSFITNTLPKSAKFSSILVTFSFWYFRKIIRIILKFALRDFVVVLHYRTHDVD